MSVAMLKAFENPSAVFQGGCGRAAGRVPAGGRSRFPRAFHNRRQAEEGTRC
jgi:hypothetical protein